MDGCTLSSAVILIHEEEDGFPFLSLVALKVSSSFSKFLPRLREFFLAIVASGPLIMDV